jgi:two-component sensor histidine kinase
MNRLSIDTRDALPARRPSLYLKDAAGMDPSLAIDFEALFSLSPNPYILLDGSLTIVGMNEAYLEATIRTREELIGRGIFEAFPSAPGSESRELLEASFARVISTRERDELALIRYDIRGDDGAMERRYWSATHTPFLGPGGEVAFILQHTVDVTELHGLRKLRDERHLVSRARAVQARNRDLAAESQRIKAMFDQAPGFIAIVDGPDHVFRIANKAYRSLTGQRVIIGRTVAEALPEMVDQGLVALLDEVYRTGEPYIGRGVRVAFAGLEEGLLEHRHLDFIFQPIFDDDGRVSQIFVQGQDVTEEVAALERQQLLIDELNHRVKNTLAIVQSLATQSFRDLDSSGAAREVFDARLRALALAHDVLTERSWQPAELDATVRGTLSAALGEAMDRVSAAGPKVLLTPQTSVSMALALHELATNAVKYGALSRGEGGIDLTWYIEDDGGRERLVLKWTESGGPRVAPPERRGFGMRLIERTFLADQGVSLLDFDPAGLRCRISLVLPKTEDLP